MQLFLLVEGLYQSNDKRRDHAAIQSSASHGALRSPSVTYGPTSLLSRLRVLLFGGERTFPPHPVIHAIYIHPIHNLFPDASPLLQGTFLECCPDQRIAHRFHRGCVTVLGSGRSRPNEGGMLFCPHCGEDASEAQEVTIPSFRSASSSSTTVVTMSASSTTTPSLPSTPTALSLTASTGGMKDGKMPERPVR